MVKILANGDIVPDNDPRAQASNRNASSGRPTQRQQQPQGGIQHGQHPGGRPGGVSIFDQLNQRLLQAGLPRLSIGQYQVEPIVSVGMLAAFLLLGFKGLLLGAVLFFVSKWSNGDQQAAGQDGRTGDGGGGGWGGQGHRLGR